MAPRFRDAVPGREPCLARTRPAPPATRDGRAILSPGPALGIGQGRCEFSFPNDEGLAQRHCELSPMPSGAMLRDLSQGLGTYVKASGERPLKAGDRLRVGQQTLQVEAL